MDLLKIVLFFAMAGIISACQPNMEWRGRIKPYQEKNLPGPAAAKDRQSYHQNSTTPTTIDRKFLAKGQERYNIFCAVCHGLNGDGQGMAIQRGFPRIESFHQNSLRKQSLQKYYDTIEKGKGSMPAFAWQLTSEERWAVAAYIRALQISAHPIATDLSSQDLQSLKDSQ